METIKYREMTKADVPVIGDLIDQAFSLSHYVSHKQTLKNFKLQYVYSCLSEATYTCVAEQNGKIVGVIMGNAKKAYRLSSHLNYIVRTLQHGALMMLHGRNEKAGIRDFKNLHKIYHDFSQKHENEFNGVLTLFAVDENCRGFGVGLKLLAGLMDYLNAQNTSRIYLYTDTTCSYEFYEHRGFERLEEQKLLMTRDGQPFQMDVFLYGYSLS